ncbi:hypothetical protein Thi970DRAFT_04852 [Thiorhodovibrio frisius]|uniref:Uncharacterized protein n=2 Tax=Thiorhodovibrio frisius TaxID=631362 RepID=H8Z8D0_9GAMM|nr:hypothetical protein Thi970DRAFT_04852 [Thiorhodovibrio frisius]WPL22366.1 Membrane-bound metallopeptidase [Thiorhodovibrio frisius]
MGLCNARHKLIFSGIVALAFSLSLASASAAEDSDFAGECDLDNNGKINGYAEVVCVDDKEIEAIERETEANRRETEAIERRIEANRRETEAIERRIEAIRGETEAIRRERERLERENEKLEEMIRILGGETGDD